VPITADDVVSPGENILAKIEALLDRTLLFVADASTQSTLAELRMAFAKINPARILIITDSPYQPRSDLGSVQVLIRPDITTVDPAEFLHQVQAWFFTAAERLAPSLVAEPIRLLERREYRSAVISAMTLLESTLRDRLELPKGPSSRGMGLRQLLEHAQKQGLLRNINIQTILGWLKVRNEVVHSQLTVSRSMAEQIVRGVFEIVQGFGS
jgi:hypothetical protein